MYKGNLVFFCGTGGTGKTQLAAAMEETLGYERYPSPTREFYRMKGVESEQQLFIQSVDFKKQFQKDLFTFYLTKIDAYITSRMESIVFERSPFCNLAYLTLHNPDFTIQDVEENFNRAIKIMVDAANLGWAPVVVLFPYPTSWIIAGKNRDNFRHIAGGKDTIIQSLMKHFAWRAYAEFGVGIIELKEDTTKNWVEEVRNNLFNLTIGK